MSGQVHAEQWGVWLALSWWHFFLWRAWHLCGSGSPEKESQEDMSRQKRRRTVRVSSRRDLRPAGGVSKLETHESHARDRESWGPGSRPPGRRGSLLRGWAVLSSTQASSRLHEARHCGKALCFTQSADLMLASSRNTFPDTPRGMLGQIPGQLMPRQVDT